MKSEESLIAVMLGVVSFILPEVLDSSVKSPIFFLVLILSMFIINVFFEYIHSIKRAYLEETDKIKTREIVYSTSIAFLSFVVCIELTHTDTINQFISWYLISISAAYFIIYCRIKGKKDTIVTIFSSKKDLLKKKEIYRLEKVHDKTTYSKLDLYVIYGYITIKQLEDAKIITDSKEEETIITGLRALSILTDDYIWEVNYAFNYYQEHNILLDSDELEDKLKRKRKLVNKKIDNPNL